ncbi:MAG: Mov34/MPN/PAD-1 family protein [Candidatus Pacearchaeota archaeon]
MSIKKFFSKIFSLDNFSFSKIKIKKKVIESIIAFARASHPKEFSAFLQGSIKNKILIIDDLIYQPYRASETATFTRIDPYLSKVFGSVHSHTLHCLEPSQTDLLFFNKKGAIHLIVCYPYTVKDIACYDFRGRKIEFEIA